MIAFKILLEILTNLRGLTTKLQMQGWRCVLRIHIQGGTLILSILKNESSVEFKKIFTETNELGKKLHGDSFELLKPT